MNFYPARPHRQFLCFVLISVLLILSCSKDSDLLSDAIFNDAAQSIEDRESQKEEEIEEEVVAEVVEIEETSEIVEEVVPEEVPLASRTTAFLPAQDAYLQDGDGINNTIIRLQADKRVSYLLYDLSAIDSIGGTITNAHFEFTVYQDPGYGEIKIHKGSATKWTEEDIDAETAPKSGIELGTIDKIYAIGQTEVVELKASEINPEITTLVLTHLEGDDLAIASKENATEEAPKLVVTYNTSLDALAIEEFFPAEEGTTEEEDTTNEEASNSDTPNNEVVNESPTAKISASPTKGEAPLDVDFKGSGSTDDVAVKAYSWDFMDGKTSRTKNPSHTFEKAGSYEVELIVADEEGLTDIETITITVEEPENAAPVAKATANKTKGEVPLKVVFDGGKSTDDNAVKKYLWDFKDGSSTSKSKRPTHTFTKEGTYKVELTVTDEKSLTDTTSITIVVEKASNKAPVAVAKANVKSGDAPLEVTFSGKNSSDDKEIVSYSWDLGSYGVVSKENPKQIFEDAGSYKVILTVQDAEGLKHSNSITITVKEPQVPETPSTSADVRYWQNKFDAQWQQDRSHAYSLANGKNRKSEYYNLSYYIDGLSSIWQATGDNDYLETALDIIEITVDDAKSVGGGYLGWPSSNGTEIALWDSYYWRHVATLLRVMHKSPSIKSKYKSIYNKLLSFSEKHIWDRYEEDTLKNFYRSKTHMASHWARIGMELYVITKKQKYKKVFDNISFGKMVDHPSNLRNQLRPNPKNSSAYAWNLDWGTTGSSSIQDTSHGGAIVQFWVLAYENGMYWNRNDTKALLKTVDIVWPESDPQNIRLNVDGSGGTAPGGRLHEWLVLGRYDQKLQNRIKKDYNKKHLAYFGSQILGIAALNAKILSDGRAAYPE